MRSYVDVLLKKLHQTVFSFRNKGMKMEGMTEHFVVLFLGGGGVVENTQKSAKYLHVRVGFDRSGRGRISVFDVPPDM